MKIHQWTGFAIVTALMLGDFFSPRSNVSPIKNDKCMQLVSSGEGEAIVEIRMDDFNIVPVEIDGLSYQQVISVGMNQSSMPRAPQLPECSGMLGVSSVKGLQVQILNEEFSLRKVHRILPAPGYSISAPRLEDLNDEDLTPRYSPDPDIYGSSDFYPQVLIQATPAGVMRGQELVRVLAHPVQYNPRRGELRIYQRIFARVSWQNDEQAFPAIRSFRSAFDPIMQASILNYTALDRSAQTEESVNLSTQVEASEISGLADSQALKVRVNQNGMYQLTPNDLTSNGFNLIDVDPTLIQISNRGQETPIYMAEDGNGSFDGSDIILFYGTAITDVYTTENVYWLTEGTAPGLRMDTRSAIPGVATLAEQFLVTLHVEQDTWYWQTMPNGLGQDHWFWGDATGEARISPNTSGLPVSRNFNFTINNLPSSDSNQSLIVRLKGFTSVISVNPDHKTQISINGTPVGDPVDWDGFSVFDLILTYNTGLLNEGLNTLTVTALGTAAPVDQYLVDYFKLNYLDTYIAEDNQLTFNAPEAGTYLFNVTGFDNNQVQVFDITNPNNVVCLTGIEVDGANTAILRDTSSLETKYLALSSDRYKQPANLELDQPSTLKSATNGADYIIIAHEDFYSSIQPLADYRQNLAGGGYRVMTVKVEDLYDEFNDGIFNPQAIRDFLSYAYTTWQSPAPAYVLLVGGASYDYRSTLIPSISRVNYVPSQMIETFLLGQTASDNWFVQLEGDDVLPEMFIGRMAVDSVTEINTMVNKTIAYEENPPDSAWNKDVLLIAGEDETAFEVISDELAASLPHYYTTNKVYAATYALPTDVTADISSHINQGSILANYAGHGNPQTWATAGGKIYYVISNIYGLNNTDKLPVVTMANCLNGFFVGRSNPSMAEAFMSLEEKGAVAVWAPTGVGFPSGHRQLLKEFYDAIFQDDRNVVGEATTQAKLNLFALDGTLGELVQTYVLFGDPATRLGIPTNYPYVESTIPADGSQVPASQPIEVRFSKPMDPTKVSLELSGPGNLTLTPTWNEDHTVVSYAHEEFIRGETYTATVSGQDLLGNELGLGLAPTTWSFTAAMGQVYLPYINSSD